MDASGAEGEVVEGGGGDLEAGGGGPDLAEAVLEEIDLEIGLLLEGFELLQTHLLHVRNPNRVTGPCSQPSRRHGFTHGEGGRAKRTEHGEAVSGFFL